MMQKCSVLFFPFEKNDSPVKELPETRESLLLQIRDPENRLAWEEFVEIYRPVVYGVAVARGLQHADALDLVQTVFVAVAGSIARWEKQDQKTRFRNWLLRVAKNATLNAMTRRPPDQATGGTQVAAELVGVRGDEDGGERELEREYQRQLYRHAAEQVRAKVSDENWQAFQMTAVEGIPIETAAREIGKSIGSVYAVRSRIMKQLAEIVSKLEESYQ